MKLSEFLVKGRTRVSDIRNIKQLNVWGCHLTDVSLLSQIPFLEVLVIANNCISSIKSLRNCHNLKEVYLGMNQIVSFDELKYLKEAKSLTKLSLKDNPCAKAAGSDYRIRVLRILPQLTELDAIEFTNQERQIVFSERRDHGNNPNKHEWQEQDVAHSSQAPSARVIQTVSPTRSSKRGAQRATENSLSLKSSAGSMVLKLSVQHNQDNGLAENPGDSNSSDCIICAHRDKAHVNSISQGREQELNDSFSVHYPDHSFRRDIAEQQLRDRNANLLSGALSLAKEMDAATLEVLHRAIRDQMRKLHP